MIEKLKKMKEIGPSAYPCSVGGFFTEISGLIRRSEYKWGECWNSANFLEEAEAIKFLAEDMLACVKAAIESKNQDLQIHSKSEQNSSGESVGLSSKPESSQ